MIEYERILDKFVRIFENGLNTEELKLLIIAIEGVYQLLKFEM